MVGTSQSHAWSTNSIVSRACLCSTMVIWANMVNHINVWMDSMAMKKSRSTIIYNDYKDSSSMIIRYRYVTKMDMDDKPCDIV